MKGIPALTKDIYDDLGYPEVMHAIGENGDKAGYKYSNLESCVPMPRDKFERLIAYVGKRARPKSTSAVYRIGSIMFQPVNAILVDKNLLQAMGDGLPLAAIVYPQEEVTFCKHCDTPVRYLPVCECRWSRR